jgi:hypothetical protein
MLIDFGDYLVIGLVPFLFNHYTIIDKYRYTLALEIW